MPSRNVLKNYVEGGIYHVYNRGVEKRDIFLDGQDYKTFLYFLKQYLIDENDPLRDTKNYKGRTFVRRSFCGRIELLAYVLMPNHFHLLLKQKGERDIAEFLKCLATSYSLYFNDKYDRVGTLFQGRYKAVLVKDDAYLLHLSRYIHLNPLNNKGPSFVIREYDYSSYQDYLGLRNTKWIKSKLILEMFDQNKDSDLIDKSKYEDFVEDYALDSGKILGDLVLE
ncbi:MAG: transposase [Patescibacteria group bacterium]|nr:transposase [Patescibacteria group bacterium]